MAESALLDEQEIESSATETTQPPGKAGRPRGRRETESTAEEKEAFFEYTSGLTTTDWERHLLYIYQWAPIVDLTRGGLEKKYRKRYTQHRDEEDIKRELGSGTYELRLNKVDGKTSKEKTIKRIVVPIVDYDFPPRIPPGQWLDDPRNIEWAWARPMLAKLFPGPEANNNSNTFGLGDMLKFLESQRNSGNSQKDQIMAAIIGILPGLLQQQSSAQDPTKYITAIKELKSMSDPPPQNRYEELLLKMLEPRQDPMVQVLLEHVKGLQAQNTAILTKMFEMKSESQKQPGPLDQMKTMSEIMTTVAGFVTPAEPKPAWASIMEEGLPGLFDLGRAYFTSRAMFDSQRSQPRAAPTASRFPEPVANSPDLNPQAQTVPNVGQPGGTVDDMMKGNLVLVAQFAAQALNLAMNGYDFADSICRKQFGVLPGEQVYSHFTNTFPKDTVIAQFRAIPEAWQFLQPFEPILPQFIEEFYTPPQDDEPEVVDVKPEPVRKGGKKK